MKLRSPFAPGFSNLDAIDLAEVLKALGDPTRLKILAMLRASGPMYGREIEANLSLKQPNVTHHLNILTEAGLITSRKESVYVIRELNAFALGFLAELLNPGGAA